MMTKEDIKRAIAEWMSEEYALGCIPASGTCAEDRMGFIAINSAEDIESIAKELLLEEPEAWEEV